MNWRQWRGVYWRQLIVSGVGAEENVSDDNIGRKIRKGIFPRIESREDALSAVKNSSNGFFGLALMMFVFSFFLESPIGPYLFFSALLIAGLANLLREYNLRTAAFILLILAINVVVGTVDNFFFGGDGGRNIVLAVLILLLAIKSVEATLKIHGKLRE